MPSRRQAGFPILAGLVGPEPGPTHARRCLMVRTLLALFLIAATASAADTPLQVLRSGVEVLDIRDGEERHVGTWRIAPDVKPDVYEAKLIHGRTHRVTFSSDVDAVSFEVEEGRSYDFVVRYRGQDCHTRIVGTRFVPPVVFDEAYRAANRGTTRVEIPEVYELVNVVFALTPTGLQDPNLVYQKSEYYQRVCSWFDRFRHHPAVGALDQELVADPARYFNLKMNAYSFEFDADGRIVQSRVYDRSGSVGERENSLRRFVPLLDAFARASDFRRFYRQSQSLYGDQIRFFETEADVQGMLGWLRGNFPATAYDGYRIIFSPLVAYNQSATWFVTPGYRELHAHVNFPYSEDLARYKAEGLSSAAARVFRGNIVFTELNHGFINPLADGFAARAAAAVAARSVWIDPGKGPNYYQGIATFNEYLNWGLVNLRFVDLAPASERTAMIALVEDLMVERRGFRRFREFSQFLLGLYERRQPGEPVADLYPSILDWFESEQVRAGTAPDGAPGCGAPVTAIDGAVTGPPHGSVCGAADPLLTADGRSRRETSARELTARR